MFIQYIILYYCFVVFNKTILYLQITINNYIPKRLNKSLYNKKLNSIVNVYRKTASFLYFHIFIQNDTDSVSFV